MQTVRAYLCERLDGTQSPSAVFVVPSELHVADRPRPFEYLEADYVGKVEAIAGSARLFERDLQPKVVASLVLEHLLQPGAWRGVADCCRSWNYVQIEADEAPDLWLLQVGMVADVMRWLDGLQNAQRIALAKRVLDAAREKRTHAVSAERGAVPFRLPCHPHENAAFENGEARCPDCGRGYAGGVPVG